MRQPEFLANILPPFSFGLVANVGVVLPPIDLGLPPINSKVCPPKISGLPPYRGLVKFPLLFSFFGVSKTSGIDIGISALLYTIKGWSAFVEGCEACVEGLSAFGLYGICELLPAFLTTSSRRSYKYLSA